MNNQIKKIISILLVIGTTFLLFACSDNNSKTPLTNSTASIKLSFDKSTEKTISLKDLAKLPIIEKEIHTQNAIEKKSTFKVKGFTLKDLCEANSIEISSYNTLSVTATDGYVANLKQDVFTNNEIIFAYEKDGLALDAKTQPLTLVIDNLPSSNFVSAITSLHFSNEKEPEKTDGKTSKIVLSDFSVLVNGLSDGEINLSSQKLVRNLTPCIVTAKVKENGAMVETTFCGYTLKDVIGFLKVDTFSEIKITAEDGFTSSITRDELDETVILTTDKSDGKEGYTTIPIRIVGKNLSGKQQVSNIVSISIVA